MKIENCVALVTGANRGLGRALTVTLLERGVRRVYATARSLRSLEPVVASAPARVVPLELDVTVPAQAKRVAEQATDVGLLFSNAGILGSMGVLEGDPAALRKDLETNLFGLVNLAKAFTPVLAKTPSSALVSILSVVSLASMPALGGYSSSKAAAWSVTQSLRAELKSRGITTHAVFPGPIDTDMGRDIPVSKTSPLVVARAILDGIEAGTADIFPDQMSSEVGALFARDPGAVERQFAG